MWGARPWNARGKRGPEDPKSGSCRLRGHTRFVMPPAYMQRGPGLPFSADAAGPPFMPAFSPDVTISGTRPALRAGREPGSGDDRRRMTVALRPARPRIGFRLLRARRSPYPSPPRRPAGRGRLLRRCDTRSFLWRATRSATTRAGRPRGAAPSPNGPTRSSSWAAAATGSRPPTTSRHGTGSRTSRSSRRAGSEAATPAATPPSSARTTSWTRAPTSTSIP